MDQSEEKPAEQPSSPQWQPLSCPHQGAYHPQEDEINLLELWGVIWRGRKLIVALTMIAALLAAGVSLLLPNIYRAEALLAPAQQDEGKGGLSAALGGLGGLASLAGVSTGGSSADEAKAVLKSREFLWRVVKQHRLMPVLFADAWDPARKAWRETDPEQQPSLWDAYRLLIGGGMLKISTDKDSGLVRLQLEWRDPELAADWVNLLVTELNTYMRQREIERTVKNLSYLQRELDRAMVAEQRQALFELISQQQQSAMLANTQQEFAFRLIDKATPPDRKVKPKRSLIVILALFLAGFSSSGFVLLREMLRAKKTLEA